MGGRAARPCWRMGVGGGEGYLHERDQPAAAATEASRARSREWCPLLGPGAGFRFCLR